MPPNSAATVLLGLLLVVGHLVRGLRAWRAGCRLERRASRRQVRTMFAAQLVVATFLIVGFFLDGWTGSSVGFSPRMAPAAQLALGAALFMCFLMFLALLRALRILGGIREDHARMEQGSRMNLSFWPRAPVDKLLTVASLGCNPVNEEILMRGLLVHQLGLQLGAPGAAVILGFVLNAALHAYQGREQITFHALFYLLQIWILFTPLGLLGCIGSHAVGDFLPVYGAADERTRFLKAARKRRRRVAAELRERAPRT